MSYYGNLHLHLQSINVPKNNDAYLTFTTYDLDGDLVDISGASEISFAVWGDAGGTLIFQKLLSGGDIVIHGDNNRFSVWIDAADSASITGRIVYHECEMTNSSGRKRTVSAGQFRAENTYTGDIV